MARKTISRKEKRAEAEAAEAQGKTKKKPAKKKTKRKSRAKAKAPADQRMKVFWGVFNQSMKQVALFEFNQKKQAQQKADEMSKGGKSPHFIQKVKREVEEE